MKLRPVAVGSVLVTIALSGCGSSSTSSSGTTTSAPTGANGAGSTVALPPGTPAVFRGVHGAVLRANDLAGFVPRGYTRPATNPRTWVAEYPPPLRAPEAARLGAAGFVAGITEKLAPTSGGGEAISVVEQFRSADAATKEVAAQLKQARTRGETAFAVTGIPGARGWSFDKPPDANVAFAVGPYYYLVGFGSSGVGAPTHAQLITAAQRLYGRVRG